MHVLKDGTVKQRSRKFYTASETYEIYKNGGHVVLTLGPEIPDNSAVFVTNRLTLSVKPKEK
jgi:hypothetical protein